MIYDTLNNLPNYLGVSDNLDTVIEYIMARDITTLPAGRTPTKPTDEAADTTVGTAGTSIAGMLCEGRFALYLAGEPYKSGLKAQGCGKLKKAVFSIELDPDEEETEE